MRKISRGVAIATVVCTLPFLASALTVEELGAQIHSLLGQIAVLQAQLGATASNPQASSYANPAQNSACPQLTRVLSRGASGNDVLQLQRFLISQELLDESSAVGYFGPLTEAAVQRWQMSHDIT